MDEPRHLTITVKPVTGGYDILACVMEWGEQGYSAINRNVAVASTYSQIPARIKSLVDVAKEHMQPAKKEAGAN